MHPVVFRSIWLMGVVAGGGSAAKKAKVMLAAQPDGLVNEISRMIWMLTDSINRDDKAMFVEAFSSLAGVQMKPGESTIDTLERAAATAEIEYAIRQTAMNTAMLAAPELADRLEWLAEALRKNHKTKEGG